MTQPQGRIVVGVDGSPASIDALKWATRQATLTGATVEAVISWQHPRGYGGYPISVEVDWPSNAHSVLDTAVAEALASEPGVVSRKVVEGHPAKVLVDAAVGADLLVVGSRGHGGFVGMLLGSVSEQVAAHASCPVLVVRDPAR
ncbi:MAG: universal stress protein [Nocardioidaceae bacterium]